MRIIRRGELPEEKEYEYTCKNCSTYFVFYKKEVKKETTRNEHYYIVRCPLCKKDIFIDYHALRTYEPTTIMLLKK